MKTHVDFEGNTHWYVYDALGRLDKEFYFATSVTGSDAGTNAAIAIDYSYDALGRVTGVSHTQDFNLDGTISSETRTTTYGYNDEGQKTSVSSAEGTLYYRYDPATGRMMSLWTGNANPALATKGVGHQLLVLLPPVSSRPRNCVRNQVI